MTCPDLTSFDPTYISFKMSEHDDTAAVIIACTSIIIANIGAAATVISSQEYNKRKRQHKVWVRHYIKQREKFGAYNRLLPELTDSAKFHNYLRMDVDTFEQLFLLVEPEISRKKTWMR